MGHLPLSNHVCREIEHLYWLVAILWSQISSWATRIYRPSWIPQAVMMNAFWFSLVAVTWLQRLWGLSFPLYLPTLWYLFCSAQQLDHPLAEVSNEALSLGVWWPTTERHKSYGVSTWISSCWISNLSRSWYESETNTLYSGPYSSVVRAPSI